MNTDEIIIMLDRLGEYQAQVDLLEIQKRELIDAVKVPDEVLAAQDEINKRRQMWNSEAASIQKDIQAVVAQLMSEVVEPELPAEYVAAMAKARSQREEIQSQAAQRYEALAKAQAEKMAALDAELQSKIKDVYAGIETRKQEINAEFGEKAEAVKENMDKLTEEIKAATVQNGKSVKGGLFQAVYVKGRVTWNTDMLDGLIVAFPALAKARKEGAPSVSIRRV